MANATPADLNIQPRDMAFGRKAPSERWWLGGDPVATAFYNALSVTFPLGERFFMDSVRHYRNDVPEALKPQIAAFLTQEAMHTREHVFFNKQVADHGFNVAAMEQRVRDLLGFVRKRPARLQLGATIALEHFTAILAHELLADPRHLQDASPEARAMWRWHAIEEVEHKAVAYDTFMAALDDLSGFRRWIIRSFTMITATVLLFSTVGKNIADIFTSDGINQAKTWRRLFHFMLVRPGMLRRIMGSYFTYFRPGFHPWEEDDRALIANAEQELKAQYAAA